MSVNDKPKITVVTPVYNEELCLDNYVNEVSKILLSVPDIHVEVLFVDDGSTDNSWHKITHICEHSPRFQAIRLSRNFGAHVALSAGLHHAKGDAVATLACDLQDPPEVILEFVEKWRKGAQIVWGQRKQRADKRWRVWASKLFFNLLKKHAMPKNSKFCTGSFLLIDRSVVSCFERFQEHNRITFALVAWTGFEQEIVPYNRQARYAGHSGWTFSLMIKTLYDAFVAFSNLPARMITLLGIIVWLLSIVFGVYLVISYLMTDVVPGWTGLMFVMTTLFGTLYLVLGLSMEYLRRIHIEVTSRPLYFISKKINLSE